MPKMGPGKSGGGDYSALPAGRYVLAMVWLKRSVGKNTGNDYLRTKMEVCGGPAKGKGGFFNLSCDLTREGTVKRWEILMDCCGVDEEFEMGSTREGTEREGDADIKRLFFGKPFVAEVKRERNNDFESNDIEKFIFPKYWTPEEQEIADEWQAAYEERGAGGSKPEDRATMPDDDDVPTAGADRYDSFQDAGQYDESPSFGGAKNGFDDDIPF